MVPIVVGINLNWRSAATVTAGDLTRTVENAITNLANASVPKYTRRILFLNVMAHILRWIASVSLGATVEVCDLPQRDEDV